MQKQQASHGGTRAPAPGECDGSPASSSGPPAWPQSHLLQQQVPDGQLQSHLYLQHALQLAQRAMQTQQQQLGKSPASASAAAAANSMKLQEFIQLHSAMATQNTGAASQLVNKQQSSPGIIPGNQNTPQQQQQQQQQRMQVPAFLFPQQGRSSPQQYEMLRMMALQQQQQQQQQRVALENSHLRLNSSETETPALHGNGITAGTPELLRGNEARLQQQQQQQQQQQHQQQQQRSVLSKPEMNPQQQQQQQQQTSFQVPGKFQAPRPGLENSPGGFPHHQASPLVASPQTEASPAPHLQPCVKFTRQQLMVLRAQILAFRRLKRGDRSFTPDMIRAITPAPLSAAQIQTGFPPASSEPKPSPFQNSSEEKTQRETIAKPPEPASEASKQLSPPAEIAKTSPPPAPAPPTIEESPTPKPTANAAEGENTSSEMNSSETSAGAGAAQLPVKASPRKYRGPLFDHPPADHDPEASLMSSNPWGIPLNLGYDVRELVVQEGVRIIGRRKARKLKVLEKILSDETLNVPSELKLKLKIEQRKLVLLKMQGKLRSEIEEHQQEIMGMGDRAYRKFVRLCERQRMELSRQVMAQQKMNKEKYLKGISQWRKKLLESHWASRDARINRNRGVAKFHERLLREYSKRRDEDRSKRMEALKNNDVVAYREMLIKQQKEIPGDAQQRFEVLESFLTQTEDYLHKLGGKISAVKNQQEREEAALAAAASARAQGYSEEDVERAAAQASDAIALRSWTSTGANSANKYYNLAHAVNERILRQPSMLRAGVLRDYQIVGLQWMLSLYNNRLNGILADEMGLGKTVQVMALIAYLMEFKGNYGPHLIIVPNAVIVNWKSELLRWLPSVSCIFYVGVREDRSRIYSQEVSALKFNVLVTTYEFIMRDRSKLAKIDWKYIIIDEAQRMKDRESRLARDLDRFRCQRRLLLTGTPLQNDLHELWSLLNLLLPEVFDNSKAFHDWFSKPFQREASTSAMEDDWLETEKKVIVIHRLHQILEPFMLRRRVEDVEGSLPPKVPVVLKCKMSAHQAAIYDWVKATGTIRLDPADEEERVAAGGNGKRQVRAYAPLQNKCMELRKVCNHPCLNYPPQCRLFNENMVRMCGKLWILDRILIKLQRSGHRVLLFSTMTKLLDILEDYLQWRGLIYRRIDGTTPLESRETAIVDFNAPGSQCFIFLLSIRAAGRGLNLQTADTVVIYDPDPNPKNEEQAVARAHRIGQKSEVKVIYMEAVVETITSFQKEDELRNGGSLDDDEMAGRDRYMGSVESLVRNNIQQHKIDMADEVINAGRFDQRTTHEERRLTLETLLHDEERYQESVHDVPTLKEVNRMISRSEEEVELFDQMDEECEWPGEMVAYDEVPEWLHVGSEEVNAAVKATSKQAMVKGGISGIVGTKAEEERAVAKARKSFPVVSREKRPVMMKPARRGRPPLVSREPEVEVEVEEDDEFEEACGGVEEESSSAGEDEEEGEIREASDEEDEKNEAAGDDGDENEMEDETSDDREETPEPPAALVPLVDQKKFGSLAELGNRSHNELGEDLEEGEIAASGDSHADSPPSENWEVEHDGDDDHVADPHGSRKRKRSARHRRKINMGNVPVQGVFPVGYPVQPWAGYTEIRPEAWNPRPAATFIHTGFANWSSQAGLKTRGNGFQEQAEEVTRRARMQENVQKKCKAVLSKLQGAMNKDGRQVSSLLMELPRHSEFPDYYQMIDKPIDAKTIEEHLDRFDYATVLDFAGDVQLMLDNASRYNTHNAEVQADARRLHSLFFQRMGLMFPDVDFNAIKINIGARTSGSRSSRKQRQVFGEPPKVSSSSVQEKEKEEEPRKERRAKMKLEREPVAKIDGEVYHPADLVVRKRKRTTRRRPRMKAGKRKKSQVESSSSRREREKEMKCMVDDGGPLSWARARKIFSGGASTTTGAAGASTQSFGSGRGGGDGAPAPAAGVNPRKKSRTDNVRRRSSTAPRCLE